VRTGGYWSSKHSTAIAYWHSTTVTSQYLPTRGLLRVSTLKETAATTYSHNHGRQRHTSHPWRHSIAAGSGRQPADARFKQRTELCRINVSSWTQTGVIGTETATAEQVLNCVCGLHSRNQESQHGRTWAETGINGFHSHTWQLPEADRKDCWQEHPELVTEMSNHKATPNTWQFAGKPATVKPAPQQGSRHRDNCCRMSAQCLQWPAGDRQAGATHNERTAVPGCTIFDILQPAHLSGHTHTRFPQ
jgi:hypothetical protein